jgi:putative oxidoreductase
MSTLLLHTSFELLNIALLVGRLFIGVCFVVHALGKLGFVGSGNMKGFAAWLKSLGVPYPELQAKVAMSSELIGGTCLALGLFARPACLLLIATMVVAALIGHKGGGYLITNNPPGNEYTINLAAISFVFLLTGPGIYSLDAFIFQ